MSQIDEARKYLNWYTDRNPCQFGDWWWLNQKFLPAIKLLEGSADGSCDSALLSDAYYRVGDVFFFQAAPLQSIKYFRLSVKACAGSDVAFLENGAAYREVGGRLEEMGRYKEAKKYLLRALKIDPKDACAQGDLAGVLESIKEPEEPLYIQGDQGWEMDECLAVGKFKKVLRVLATPHSEKDHQRRASAFGGLGMPKNFISEWECMIDLSGAVEMRNTDWFYMPDKVWNDPKFWRVIAKLRSRFIFGTWGYHASLWEHVVPSPTKYWKRGMGGETKRTQKRIYLFAQYHIARLDKDRNLSKRLADKHPNWPEMVKLNSRLNNL